MNKTEAMEAISTGYAIWSVRYAEQVCDWFGVSCPSSLVRMSKPKEVVMYNGPERGVWSLDLAEHVAQTLGVAAQAQHFFGLGSQAREYARLIEAAMLSLHFDREVDTDEDLG